MTRVWIAGLIGLSVSFGSATAYAATCTVAGHTYTCEAMCTGTTPCNVELSAGHAACDSPLLGGNGDGYCTICGDGAANTITGTDGADVICGKGGNDTIYGDNSGTVGGDDIISGGDGDDHIVGKLGNDRLFGDDGNDTIQGAQGDDEIDGGNGNDSITGDKGNDVLRGGPGDDYVDGRNAGSNDTADLGDIVCGGPGNDVVVADGSGAHCLDAGPDQAPGADDCYYSPPTYPDVPDAGDFATGRNCQNQVTGNFQASTRSCNCQD